MEIRGVIWLKNGVCYRDWSSYPGKGLVTRKPFFGRGGHRAVPACWLHARCVEPPKVLGLVQVSGQAFESYVLWLMNSHHSTDLESSLC